MEFDLFMSSNLDVSSPEFFFQSAVDSLCHSSFIVPDFFGRRKGDCPVITGIFIDNGCMPYRSADVVNRFGIIGRIHEIIEGGHLPGGQLHHGDSNLAVMEGGRTDNSGDRKSITGGVNVALISYPGLSFPSMAVASRAI